MRSWRRGCSLGATGPELRAVVVRGQAGGRMSAPLFAIRPRRPSPRTRCPGCCGGWLGRQRCPTEVIAVPTPHVARHTTAELADMYEIMELLGHMSITTTPAVARAFGRASKYPTSVAERPTGGPPCQAWTSRSGPIDLCARSVAARALLCRDVPTSHGESNLLQAGFDVGGSGGSGVVGVGRRRRGRCRR